MSYVLEKEEREKERERESLCCQLLVLVLSLFIRGTNVGSLGSKAKHMAKNGGTATP